MTLLRDNWSRIIDYMRISITDRCNLGCIYCVPEDGTKRIIYKEILSYEEIARVITVASALGVRKVRLTGGEPLTRKNFTRLISSIKKIGGIEDLSLTTNGVLLERYAAELACAGLDRVNVSLDSLKPERYSGITKGADIGMVLRGIRAAGEAGLLPLKINMVPIRGINDDEIAEFASLTITSHLHVRFIELMPAGHNDFWSMERHISTDEIKSKVEKLGCLEPVHSRKNGPARYFRLEGAQGVIGFISAITHHFCADCNRLRLTADGMLRPCLFSETEIDLKPALRGGAPDSEIERLLRLAIEVKPERHFMEKGIDLRAMRPMLRIGG